MVAELAKISCFQCGSFLLDHPQENMRTKWLKCPSCGHTRPQHYSNLPKVNENDSPKKVREKLRKK